MPNKEPTLITNAPTVAELSKKKAKKSRKPLIITIVLIVCVLAVAGVCAYFVIKNNQKSDFERPDSYSESKSHRTPDDFEETTKKKIANETDPETVFDTQISLASYYISSKRYADAQEFLLSIDLESLSAYQRYRYANIMINLYNASNDRAKRDEWMVRASEYRTAYQKEMQATSE